MEAISKKLVALKWLNADWANFSSAFDLLKPVLDQAWVEDANVVMPIIDQTFRAFNECSVDSLKVVILGQD